LKLISLIIFVYFLKKYVVFCWCWAFQKLFEPYSAPITTQKKEENLASALFPTTQSMPLTRRKTMGWNMVSSRSFPAAKGDLPTAERDAGDG